MSEEFVRASVATGMEVAVSTDGRSAGLVFTTAKAPVSIAVPLERLGLVISKLLNVAVQTSGRKPTRAPAAEMLSAHPIEAGAIGISPGRTDSEALVSIRCGELTLVFALQLSTLLEMLESVKAQTTTRASAPKTH